MTAREPPLGRLFSGRPVLDNEKKIILAFRSVVALVAFTFVLKQPADIHIPWQFYFVMAVFVFSNVVFLFEGEGTFNTHRAQMYIFGFDVGMLTILMIFLGLTNKEFYLVFFLTIFVSALSKKTSHAFAISAVMAGLYVVFAIRGEADVDLTSASFLVRVVLFFVVSSFVGHISEVAESSRLRVSMLTEWKKRAQKLAIEQDKMAAVGLLAAGVAHEFNNLLAGIKGYADLAKSGDAEPGEAFELISGQCSQAASIVRDLLSFSRKRGGEPELVDVSEAVDQVLRLVRKELAARNIELERRVSGRPCVRAEPGAVERTVLNLLNNSIAAVERDGRVWVGVSAANRSVEISVADDGPGLDQEVLDRAFEPFFTTQDSSSAAAPVRSAGLGLAVSKQLVERSGGRISLERRPGGGARARISLPAADAMPLPGAVKSDRPAAVPAPVGAKRRVVTCLPLPWERACNSPGAEPPGVKRPRGCRTHADRGADEERHSDAEDKPRRIMSAGAAPTPAHGGGVSS
jgi:signal transduction histidine kinase